MKHFDIDQLKSMLRGQGEAMMHLADNLGKGGDKLEPRDKELVRMAVYPALKESSDLLLSAFLLGNRDWKDHEAERFSDLLTVDDMF